MLLSTMEALAAISLASNIAQFVEYAVEFTKRAQKFASSDSEPISQHRGMREITECMTAAIEEIKRDNTDSALSSLAGQCIMVASTVQGIISDLSKKPEDTLIRSLHKAGKTLYKQKEMQQLAELLSNMRAQVSQHLLVLIRSVLASSRQDGMALTQCEVRNSFQLGKRWTNWCRQLRNTTSVLLPPWN